LLTKGVCLASRCILSLFHISSMIHQSVNSKQIIVV
jgi:hypothetical protein